MLGPSLTSATRSHTLLLTFLIAALEKPEEIQMDEVVTGTIRGVGGIYKKSGAPQLEIHVPIGRTGALPIQLDERVPIQLQIDGAIYPAGLRCTTDNDKAWICPEMTTVDGESPKPEELLTAAGFSVNIPVQLLVTGSLVEVRRG